MSRSRSGASSIGPYLILLCAGLLLAAQWGAIPERFPVQWGAAGAPSRFVAKTPLGVLLPLLIGMLVCGLLRAIARALPEGTERDAANRDATTLALLATEYLVATVFAVVGLATALAWPRAAWLVTATALVGIAALVAFLVTIQWRYGLRRKSDGRAARAFKWGLFYSDPNDPALLVPKRFALGYTLNFGHPRAWLLLAALVALALCIAFVSARVSRG